MGKNPNEPKIGSPSNGTIVSANGQKWLIVGDKAFVLNAEAQTEKVQKVKKAQATDEKKPKKTRKSKDMGEIVKDRAGNECRFKSGKPMPYSWLKMYANAFPDKCKDWLNGKAQFIAKGISYDIDPTILNRPAVEKPVVAQEKPKSDEQPIPVSAPALQPATIDTKTNDAKAIMDKITAEAQAKSAQQPIPAPVPATPTAQPDFNAQMNAIADRMLGDLRTFKFHGATKEQILTELPVLDTLAKKLSAEVSSVIAKVCPPA
jgi:hypothetical protein